MGAKYTETGKCLETVSIIVFFQKLFYNAHGFYNRAFTKKPEKRFLPLFFVDFFILYFIFVTINKGEVEHMPRCKRFYYNTNRPIGEPSLEPPYSPDITELGYYEFDGTVASLEAIAHMLSCLDDDVVIVRGVCDTHCQRDACTVCTMNEDVEASLHYRTSRGWASEAIERGAMFHESGRHWSHREWAERIEK